MWLSACFCNHPVIAITLIQDRCDHWRFPAMYFGSGGHGSVLTQKGPHFTLYFCGLFSSATITTICTNRCHHRVLPARADVASRSSKFSWPACTVSINNRTVKLTNNHNWKLLLWANDLDKLSKYHLYNVTDRCFWLMPFEFCPTQASFKAFPVHLDNKYFFLLSGNHHSHACRVCHGQMTSSQPSMVSSLQRLTWSLTKTEALQIMEITHVNTV